MAAGAWRLCTDVSTQVEVIIKQADAITRFPLLYAVFSTHVDSLIFCADVRASDCWVAVLIAVAKISLDMNTRTVHLGAAEQSLFISIVHTGQASHTSPYEGEDAGTAGVRTTDCVAAGAWRLCTDVPTEVEVIIIRAGSITRIPLLQADLPAHVEA